MFSTTSGICKKFFAVVALLLLSQSVFASTCAGVGMVSGATNPSNVLDPAVRAALSSAAYGTSSTALIAVSNTSTGYYAIYASAVIGTGGYGWTMQSSGRTSSGYPPADSGCPKTDKGTTSSSGGAAGGGNTGGGAGGGLPGLGGGGCVGNCGTVTVGNPTPSP